MNPIIHWLDAKTGQCRTGPVRGKHSVLQVTLFPEICNVIANTVRRYANASQCQVPGKKMISPASCARLSELANCIISNEDTTFSNYEQPIIGESKFNCQTLACMLHPSAVTKVMFGC